ncbi:MAG: MBL fold metallo-hydrolase, partial [bacterium]|nr:MBL fold metallo-hydrolase [bacterium]
MNNNQPNPNPQEVNPPPAPTPDISSPQAKPVPRPQGNSFQRKPFSSGPRATSVIGARAPQPQINPNRTQNNRMVLGRTTYKAPINPKHVAGARMQIVRPEAAKPMRRAPAKPSVRREGDVIPPMAEDTIRIIPLGGVEEIGKNMTAIQYGDDIVVIDIGFQFKDDETPGIDFILPNTKYLEERVDKVRAVIITHGHLDHIGGIPYIMPRIGNPPVYTRLLTSILIQKRQEEFPHVPKVEIKLVEKNETITIGKLRIKFFAVTHTIPDAMGVIIETPYGSIVHTGDLKLDHVDGVPTDEEVAEYDRAFKNEKVLILMADSTNVENPGFSLSEKTVHRNLEMIIKDMHGRLIIATFSSLLERLLKICEFAEKYGKKVIVEGRSLK